MEEEISEAILEPLGWRAEGRAQQPVRVRGGVLADEVGYGKTAITLGLIDSTRKSVKKEVANANAAGDMPGKIRVSATLVVVPGHLTKQWASEVQKFVGANTLKVVLLQSVAHLNSLKIEDVQEADIVIVASSLFKGINYLDNLEAFAAGGSLPKTDGRYFNTRLDESLRCLHGQVDRLRTKGSLDVMAEIHAARKKGAWAVVLSERLGIDPRRQTKRPRQLCVPPSAFEACNPSLSRSLKQTVRARQMPPMPSKRLVRLSAISERPP